MVPFQVGFILFMVHVFVYSQPESAQEPDDQPDSIIHYADYSELLAFRIYTNTKWNTLDIISDDYMVKFRPNGPTALGVGFNYKAYGLGIAIGIPKSSSSNSKYGKTNRLDVQLNVYSKKIGIDGFAQMYRGYYVSNPQDFIVWEEEYYPQLPDMKIYTIGLHAFYIFNSDKFSYKAAFVRNQIQIKSAGSLTAGIFGQIDIAETDRGFIPEEFPDSIQTNFDLKAFKTSAVGVSVGYLYTWVISRKFFFNIGIIPGFGLQTIHLENLAGEKASKNAPAAQLAGRTALGFDSQYFYAGITANVIWRSFQYKGYDLDLATEQLRFFIGKRFKLNKK